MNITVIYGQRHKGNTWALANLFLERLKNGSAHIEEFFLPDHALGYCTGCVNCIMKDENLCPHAHLSVWGADCRCRFRKYARKKEAKDRTRGLANHAENTEKQQPRKGGIQNKVPFCDYEIEPKEK